MSQLVCKKSFNKSLRKSWKHMCRCDHQNSDEFCRKVCLSYQVYQFQSAELYPFKVGFFLLFHVKYVANSSKENYNLANKFRQKPKQHVYYIRWKIAFRLLKFNISWILPHVGYGIAVKLDITNIGEKPRANLTLTTITLPSFVFVFKTL